MKNWKTSTLIQRALAAGDEDKQWKIIHLLRWRGSQEVLDQALELTNMRRARERVLGTAILAQLGVPKRTFPEQALKQFHHLIKTDPRPSVLEGALFGICHTQDSDDQQGLRRIARLRDHPRSKVRWGVVHALWGREDALSIRTLIQLSDDRDDEIRDWATCSLGTLTEIDTPAVRRALLKRCDDRHGATRAEGIMGLARRKHPQARAWIQKELERAAPGTLTFEAAVELGDPALLDPLREMLKEAQLETPPPDSEWLDVLSRAIADLS